LIRVLRPIRTPIRFRRLGADPRWEAAVENGPTIGCPGCGEQLALRSVVRRGGRRFIECPHCGESNEWPIGDERPPPRRRPPEP
jgi:hypothetical protein